MDERWVLEWLIPPATPDELLAFSAKVVRAGTCLVWSGAVNASGYGMARFRDRSVAAHRLAFVLVHGGWPRSPYHVAHRCDEKLCVKPSHLLLSTASENSRDLWRLREDGSGRLPARRLGGPARLRDVRRGGW